MRRSASILIFAILSIFTLTNFAFGQHFEVVEATETTHSIAIGEATIDGNDLVDGDEIGVFTPEGVCAGVFVLDG
ncbi:hypothetical protein ACFLQV_04705, partial [Calditrichota bacterium]